MSALFNTTILGSSAAIPTSLRHTSAQVVQHHNRRFLIDCAEGTQMQMRRFKIPLMKINHVFISHLHGDHYLGLPGLLFTFHLLGREKELHVYSPPGLQEIIEVQYKLSELTPSFPISYHELTQGRQPVYEDEKLCIETIAMEHRIPTYGFLLKEKPEDRKIIKSAITKYNIPTDQMQGIKKGSDLVAANGAVISNRLITKDPLPSRCYAFCSDTAYTERFLDQVKGVDLLYHEATFMHEKADIARQKMHTTTTEAASLARKAGVRQLMIGHYSARYKELSAFREEAANIFPQTILAREGDVVPVGKPSSPTG